ncbi:hypothetical protein UC8_47350 [Roseimaritima ulvae]|uniref:Uncharacterized protein n=1 Tax=Roseimaritima ulvae TaxID=980254 RepID=A0A5B9R827_9BACT|nr:hypothetical protein UC8_47350 [Roseimaritima ulvae]
MTAKSGVSFDLPPVIDDNAASGPVAVIYFLSPWRFLAPAPFSLKLLIHLFRSESTRPLNGNL